MPWVNWTPTIQRAPKSERNTSVRYEPHAKQQRWETTTLGSGTDGYRVRQDAKLFPTWVTWPCKLWPICASSCLCFFLPCHKVLRSRTSICLSDYMHLLPSSGCRPLKTAAPMVARKRGHVGGSVQGSFLWNTELVLQKYHNQVNKHWLSVCKLNNQLTLSYFSTFIDRK